MTFGQKTCHCLCQKCHIDGHYKMKDSRSQCHSASTVVYFPNDQTYYHIIGKPGTVCQTVSV